MIFLTLYTYIILSCRMHLLTIHYLAWFLFLTYLSGSIGSAFTGKLSPLAMHDPVYCRNQPGGLGTLLTLYSLLVIIIGLLINGLGFFIALELNGLGSAIRHNSQSSASSLYLVFYYLAASVGTLYLQPFWQWQQWQGVVSGAVIMLMITVWGGIWLRRREKLNSASFSSFSCRVFSYQLSSKKVTGPSLVRATCISAAKTPLAK